MVNLTGGATGGYTPYGYTWTLGSTVLSTTQNVSSYTLTKPETLVFNLTVRDASGAISLAQVDVTATAPATLTADATASPQTGVPPLAVQFTLSGAGGWGPYTYSWAFGDGSATSTAPNVTHVYQKVGTYDATFWLNDTHGQTISRQLTIQVTSGVFTVQVATSPSPATEVGVQTTFSATTAGATLPLSCSWNFGDGSSPSTSTSPIYAYSNPSTGSGYDVVVTITDARGNVSTGSLSLAVYSAVTASATITSGGDGEIPLATQFAGSGSNGATPYSYSWDFGDGSAPSTIQNAPHSYTTANTYTVTLTLTDALGVKSTSQVTVHAYPDLSVSFSGGPYDNNQGDVNIQWSFGGSTTGGSGTETSWGWSWGDGNSASGQSASHTYSNPGQYTITLTVVDSANDQAQATKIETLNSDPAGTATASPTTGNAPLTVNFASSISGGTLPYYYYTNVWYISGGQEYTVCSPNSGAFACTLTIPQTYYWAITVTDSSGWQLSLPSGSCNDCVITVGSGATPAVHSAAKPTNEGTTLLSTTLGHDTGQQIGPVTPQLSGWISGRGFAPVGVTNRGSM
jgi:PKD repeat protein